MRGESLVTTGRVFGALSRITRGHLILVPTEIAIAFDFILESTALVVREVVTQSLVIKEIVTSSPIVREIITQSGTVKEVVSTYPIDKKEIVTESRIT
jgi:hypothetical protein